MAGLDVLLGALQGFTDKVGGEVDAQQAAKIKAAQDKKAFGQKILEGVILQSMKPKSKDLSFGDDLVGQAENYIDPELVNVLKTMGIGKKSSGGGGGGSGSLSSSPFIFGKGGSSNAPKKPRTY